MGLLLAVSSGSLPAATLGSAHDAAPRLVTSLAAGGSASAEQRLSVQLPDGQRQQLALRPQTQLLASAARRALRDGPTTQAFAGTVVGVADSWVRVTRIGGAWTGAISTPAGLWLLDPAAQHPAWATALQVPASGTLIYSPADAPALAAFADDEALPPVAAQHLVAASQEPESATSGAQPRYEIELTLVLDTAFQSHYGSDAVAVAVAAANTADGFYRAQLDTRVRLMDVVPMQDAGGITATAASGVLGQFRTWTISSGLSYKDGVHLLTGRDFDGGILGMAWSGAMCDATHSAGVEQATSGAGNAAILLAHELGHTVGLPHDSGAMGTTCPKYGYIMGGMSSSAHSFSTCSVDQYHAWLASHNHACMTPDIIYVDGFDSAAP